MSGIAFDLCLAYPQHGHVGHRVVHDVGSWTRARTPPRADHHRRREWAWVATMSTRRRGGRRGRRTRCGRVVAARRPPRTSQIVEAGLTLRSPPRGAAATWLRSWLRLRRPLTLCRSPRGAVGVDPVHVSDFRLPHVTGDRPHGLWVAHWLNDLYTKAAAGRRLGRPTHDPMRPFCVRNARATSFGCSPLMSTRELSSCMVAVSRAAATGPNSSLSWGIFSVPLRTVSAGR